MPFALKKKPLMPTSINAKTKYFIKLKTKIEALNSEFIEKHNEEARLYKALHENLFSRV